MISFYMSQPREIRAPRADGLPGILLGRFLPATPQKPYSYTVTDGNKDHVQTWVSEGAAHIGIYPGSAASIRAAGGSVGGSVAVKT